ncbi:putative AIG1 domain protein [Rhizoctonia solani 123E]|uniref:Putative AIG1 domain protein n=1 Tax=Rhizoctonia solani 123E TaxID=1423351 RepID=A0A074RIY8_9AGAM|nr:putative AIG1 domain protein [Rhizoctonia solani 123E]
MFGGYLGNITQLGFPRFQDREPPSLHMLVMGLQGCGKSSLINLAIGRPDCTVSGDSTLCTQFFHSCQWPRSMNGWEFRFTDTPGFGNEMIDDRRIFELLVENLAPNSYKDRSAADDSNFPQLRTITGLIYIYSEDEPFKNRISRKTIEMLVKVLGERFLDRVTVLIRSQKKSQIESFKFMPDKDSPLYPLYCNDIKPRTLPYEQDPRLIERILAPYTGLYPRAVQLAVLDEFAQKYSDNWRHSDIPRYLRGFFPEDIGPPKAVDQLRSLLQGLTNEHKKLQDALDRRTEEMRGLQLAHNIELEYIRREREHVELNHGIELKYLHDTLRGRAREEVAELKSSRTFENKELRTLVSQKEEEIKNLRSTHDAELKNFQKDREKENFNHELGLKRLYSTIQEQEVEISKLKPNNSSGSRIKELQNQLQARNEELTKLKASKKEADKLKSESDSEIKRLRTLLAQKETEMNVLRSTHEVERERFREERSREKIDQEVALKVLQNKVEDRDAAITQLKSSRDSEFERLEAANNEEISKLSTEMGSEIERLQRLLAQEEIQDLRSSHGTGLKHIQKFAQEIELSCKHLLDTIREEGVSNTESNEESGLEELEAMTNMRFSIPGSKLDSKIRAFQDGLQAKDEELTKLKTDSERRIQEAMDVVQAMEQEIAELKTKMDDATTQMGNNQGGDAHILNPEISRAHTEHESLLHSMQPQERIEPAQITTELGQINRLIEEFGQSLSEHIEEHMKLNSPQNDLQSAHLLNLFGPVGKKLASKNKQDAYLLFEYAIQATICGQLYTHLFKPFHPSTADDEKSNTFLMQLYSQMTRQEPQTVAGRWRKDAFNSMSKDLALGGRNGPNNRKLHQLLTEALSALLGKVVAIQPHEVLQEHDKALVKVIAKAEQFNNLLKGVVSVLGDFRPIAFHFGEAFQPDYMTEVTSNPKKVKRPETILATVGLGLVKSYALGANQNPEETILRKAVILGLFK